MRRARVVFAFAAIGIFAWPEAGLANAVAPSGAARVGDRSQVASAAARAAGKAEGKAGAAKAAAPVVQRKRRRVRKIRLSYGVVPRASLRKEPLPPPSGEIHLVNTALHEEVTLNIYNSDGSYSIDALEKANHILRCKRTGEERGIEPRLLAILSHVHDRYRRPIQVVSAFRYQRKTTSFHYKGSAVDIRVAGVTPTQLRLFLDGLDEGTLGVGLYPRSDFVHVDVRPPPSFRWIDYSKSDPGARDKQPPKTWRRKKLS